MEDIDIIMKRAQQHIAEVSWCSTTLRRRVRQGSKAQLLAELLYRYASETQGIIETISHDMELQDLETIALR